MKRTSLIVTLLVLAGGGYGAYKYFAAPAKLEFLKAAVTRGSIESAISATGTLASTLSVNVGSQVSGNVLQMLADFNTPVKKGQLIAVIDPSTYQTKVDQAEATLRSAKTQILSAEVAEKRADFDVSNADLAIVNQKAAVLRAQSQLTESKRKLDLAKQLFTSGIGTKDSEAAAQATYDQAVLSLESAVAQQKTAEASLQSTKAQREVTLTQKTTAASQITNAEAALEAAKLDLERTRILAPVDGVVVARNMSPGQTVQASTTAPQLFEIAKDLSRMEVDVNIDESDISSVQEGQSATFTVDAYPGQTFRGEVFQVRHAPTNVQNVITYTVVIAVDNSDMRLFPGMTANTRIVTQGVANTLRIPSSALRFRPPAQLTVVGDVGKGKGGGFKGGNASDGGAKETSATKADEPQQVARVAAKDGVANVTAPQAGAEVAADAGSGPDGQGRRGKGGKGGFDRTQFQGKNGKAFDRSQFQGQGGGRNGADLAAAFGPAAAGGGRGGRGAGTGRAVQQQQTVYRLNAKNEIEAVRIRTGISDGAWVALLSNNLEEGAELITAVEGLPVVTNTKAPTLPGVGGANNKGGGFGGGRGF